VVRTVDVTNNTETSQDILTESINGHDSDGLGDELNLVIKEGATTLYDDTLGNFLISGPVPLSSLGAELTTTYSFGVIFNPDAGNDTQSGDLGFDLCVGFSGGEMNCGDTVIGGGGTTPPPPGPPGPPPPPGGGGGTPPPPTWWRRRWYSTQHSTRSLQ
jgi:hypothetical protein